jgi:AraC-like DNA-binding protein
MLIDQPLQVIRLADFDYPSTNQAHRHQFLMLLWITAGDSQQMVNYRNHHLSAGQLLFIQEGQIHRVVRPARDGWMILFQSSVYRAFINCHHAHELHGLFDPLNRQPVVLLDEKTQAIYAAVIPLLQAVTSENPSEDVIVAYLSILLYHANQLFRPLHPFLVHPAQAEQVRQLKNLIERNFKTERTAPFYANKLGMVTRKLNELTQKLNGKLVHEMVNDRLLSEAELLLASTSLTVKEITFELGFIDHSHFGAYFKRMKGITASDFRRQQQARPRT